MEEYMTTLPLIIHGCKLAKELESSFLEKKTIGQNIEDIANLCDQISKIFGSSSKRLRSQADHHCNNQRSIQDNNNNNIDSSLNEWLGNGAMQGMDVINQPVVSTQGMAMGLMASARTNSSQRQRRRRERSDTRIVKMAAPQIGNTEIPPDDGYTWRKYGQKEIMGKKYPRGYFRCTHQRQFKCPAKKQAQRDELEPNMFEVMYQGNHTCHLSATAPSMLPSQAVILSHDNRPIVTSSTVTSSTPLGNWLSMEFSATRNTDFAGPSRYGKELNNVLEFPVVDMADEMFNSGHNSTGNNIDFLFPIPAEQHKRQ